MKHISLNTGEYRAIAGLGMLYAFRMLGLFMVLPVLSLYARELNGATPFLIGIALGGYGLAQAIFQIPFGALSDRLGRKQIIAFGLLLFFAGSVMAALSTSIYGVIAGRCLQGSGAIAGALMALLADKTREETRTTAMAAIGMSIGLAFALAMALGPFLAELFGLSGVFWSTALLALVGLLILWRLVPSAPARQHRDVGVDPGQLGKMLFQRELLRLNFSIFALHAILTGCFIALPLRLESLGIEAQNHGWVYLPVMAAGFFIMIPLIIAAEKYRHMKVVFMGAVAAMTLALMAMSEAGDSRWLLITLLLVFFTGFNLMEAMLPSLISKLSPAGAKGTAMGVYSTSQFLGASLGGGLGGAVAGHFGIDAVFLFAAALGSLWFLSILNMATPKHLSSEIISLKGKNIINSREYSDQLKSIEGVEDVLVVEEENVAYLKIDRDNIDRETLTRWLQTSS
ncbi:MFS transporter [Kushneria pakistanensis]|uniref:MFS transporter n=1 Tax=Kushneria pakistanensis TaxID=1508770 RepID=A0ABQ3FJW6_9GAMM|nr:MFS transporter [Kushneria pakistanensis]GHC27468.1 MFS transporter [Kushneria pakistanensis]